MAQEGEEEATSHGNSGSFELSFAISTHSPSLKEGESGEAKKDRVGGGEVETSRPRRGLAVRGKTDSEGRESIGKDVAIRGTD